MCWTGAQEKGLSRESYSHENSEISQGICRLRSKESQKMTQNALLGVE